MNRPLNQLPPEKRFQLLLDSACDYAIFFMLPNGSICEWSAGAENIIGFSEEEALQLNGDVIFTSEDHARGMHLREMEQALREGQANDERWHVRKDGTHFFAVGRLVCLRNDDGNHVGFAKILRDATPFKQVEQALRASEAQLRSLVAQAPWGIALLNLDARIDEVNPAFCRLAGLAAEQLRGRHLVHLAHPDDAVHVHESLERCFNQKQDSIALEKRILRPDGTAVWVQNSITILRDAESRPIGILDLCQDISALKTVEEDLAERVNERTAALQDKTAQMEAFCYTVAHDLRAPLRAISGYAEILKIEISSLEPADGQSYLERIDSATKKMDALIQDLLSYTRVQQVPVLREIVNLDDIIDAALRQLADPQHREDIQIRRPLGVVRGDTVALQHVFSNLISNGIKFARPEAAPQIRVFSEICGDRLRVSVQDNGIGIDPRYKDRAFQMFERVHPHLNVPGTGVGLAIVAKAIERLGGSYGVDRVEPHGSRFWIELPR